MDVTELPDGGKDSIGKPLQDPLFKELPGKVKSYVSARHASVFEDFIEHSLIIASFFL